MMTLMQCDKCKFFFEVIDDEEPTMVVSGNKVKHLCPKCTRKLQDWFAHPEEYAASAADYED